MKNKACSSSVTSIKAAGLAMAFCCLLFSFYIPYKANANSSSPDEATLRALIILKIIHQVSWPEETGKTINLCSSGASESSGKLRQLLASGRIPTRLAAGRLIENSKTKDATCHVQILGAGKKVKRPPTDEPLLTICDGCALSTQHAAVEVIRNGEHIGFNLNLAEAKRKNIRFKVSLMELANNIKGHHDK